MAFRSAVARLDVRKYKTKTHRFSMETPSIFEHTNRAAASASAGCYRLLLAVFFLLSPAAVGACCWEVIADMSYI